MPLDNIVKRAEAYKHDVLSAVEGLKHPTAEKVEAIKDALKHFEII